MIFFVSQKNKKIILEERRLMKKNKKIAFFFLFSEPHSNIFVSISVEISSGAPNLDSHFHRLIINPRKSECKLRA